MFSIQTQSVFRLRPNPATNQRAGRGARRLYRVALCRFADLQSAGRRSDPKALEWARRCRLQICDTAECNSALRRPTPPVTSGCSAESGAYRNSRPEWRPRFRRLCPPHASINHTASRRALIKVNRGPRTPFCAAVRPSLSLSDFCSCSCSCSCSKT